MSDNHSEHSNKPSAKTIMVLGTTSGAGKSFLTTALCRWYARQGYKVAPFKAQNMSNNARVVPGPGNVYGEIGSAQYFQALAARAAPEVRMNPVLLKPEADTRSQVILMGQVATQLADIPWRERSAHLWPAIAQSLDALRAENDVLVIEGAGSPAEINLQTSDIVNMRVALHAQARCLLVTDIDRGGAFAHLYGTWHFLPTQEKALIKGFVLNKFRGDAALLAPGPEMLQAATGVPTLAVLPMWWNHGLPEEDGVFDASSTGGDSTSGGTGTGTRIAIIAYPRISNLDEFQTLKNVPGVRLTWARSPADLQGADWIILPGSKHTTADLAWLRAQRLAAPIAAHAARGAPVLGICGGLQMLGEALVDTQGIESIEQGNAPGLGLLDVVTHFEARKTVQPVTTAFAGLKAPWQALSNVSLSGYEIHHGNTIPREPASRVHAVLPHNLGWSNQQGNVLGIYIHGLFECPSVLHALFGAQTRSLDNVLDAMADYVELHFGVAALAQLVDKASGT